MYEYTLKFRNTTAHGNADTLSQLPLLVVPANVEKPPELVLLTEHLQDSPVTANHICSWTQKDPILSKVVQFFQQGWPSHGKPSLTPFFSKRTELSLYEGFILWVS